MSSFPYIGTELQAFAYAKRWKDYVWDRVRPYTHGNVLEVGAGIGSNTEFFKSAVHHWTCLEPDNRLAALIQPAPGREVVVGTILDLEHRQFDSILYIDVLEHIEQDVRELSLASQRLNPGGHLIVLAPAHNWLFSEMDHAIGHFRRYNRQQLLATAPPELKLKEALYLDSFGVMASLANRYLLRSKTPSVQQIQTWDTLMIPVSRIVDGLLGHTLGKSVLAIWQKPN